MVFLESSFHSEPLRLSRNFPKQERRVLKVEIAKPLILLLYSNTIAQLGLKNRKP